MRIAHIGNRASQALDPSAITCSPRFSYARLTAIKDACDPDNTLHLNHDIAPSGRAEDH